MDIGGWEGLVKRWNSVEKEAYHFTGTHETRWKYNTKSAYFKVQARIKWLSVPWDESDERDLVGGVRETGEVGGLGVAHWAENKKWK